MNYVSTRGRAPDLPFDDVLLTGLARDGGLYVPDAWPALDSATLRAVADMPYAEAATRLVYPFVDGMTEEELADMAADAYARFDHPDVAPLRELADSHWLMELFHGPTLAFKDLAMQLLGRMFDHVLKRRGERVTIVGATSGDTGSAAIEACRDRDAIEIFILHPHGRVSEVQRRQMTTVTAANVHNIAIEGTFDDCQSLVKAMFNDLTFRDRHQLSAVNSINWARVVAQIVYFIKAAAMLGAPGRKVAFSVPTGNFGCVYAGYVAARMGLPVSRLLVATNRNDILHRFFQNGAYTLGEVFATQSPSMDIQVASNFERLLFDLTGRDGAAVSTYMDELKQKGGFDVGANALAEARTLFDSRRVDEDATTATMADVHTRFDMLIDPHTAVALRAAEHGAASGEAVVTLSTAHPAKFPDAVERATGLRPALPNHLSDLFEREERCAVLANDLAAVQTHINETLARR